MHDLVTDARRPLPTVRASGRGSGRAGVRCHVSVVDRPLLVGAMAHAMGDVFFSQAAVKPEGQSPGIFVDVLLFNHGQLTLAHCSLQNRWMIYTRAATNTGILFHKRTNTHP